MDLSNLKSRRYDINKLVEAAQEANGGNQKDNNRDENLWKPTVDSSPPKTKFRGSDIGIMVSKVQQASGTSKSH